MEYMKMNNKYFTKKVGASAAAAMAAMHTSTASAYDWSTITAGIDFSGEITAIAAIVSILAGIAVVMLGGRKVLKMLGGN
jgi:hypothetical protein